MKARVVRKKIGDKHTADMFNQILGAGAVNIKICYPKYIDMKDCIGNIIKVFKVLCENPYVQNNADLAVSREQIVDFVARSEEEYKKLYSITIPDYDWNLVSVPEKTKKDFAECYEASKDSFLLHTLMNVCKNLSPYKRYLTNESTITHTFIMKIPGNEFCPLPFSNINFKSMVVELTANTKQNEQELKIITLILCKLYKMTYNLYEIFSRPDVDIEEFSKIIMSNIGEVKKRIPRCDKAFKKIEESIHLLKRNFGEYFKDFTASQDSTIIMQSFISDVSQSASADLETTRQFKDIIMHYKKLSRAQGKNANPQVAALFKKASEGFKMLDGIKKNDDDDADADDAEDGADEDDADDNADGADGADEDADEDDADDGANEDDTDNADDTEGVDDGQNNIKSEQTQTAQATHAMQATHTATETDSARVDNSQLSVDELMVKMGFQTASNKGSRRTTRKR